LTPLVFTGLAVAYGYRGGFFNIGAEGQLYLGAIAATWIGITLTNLPGWLLVPIAMAGAALAGSLWAAVPGYLKAARGFNEVVTTLLMNYIAYEFFNWIVRIDHPATWTWRVWTWLGLKDPTQPFPQSADIVAGAQLPSVAGLLKSPTLGPFLSETWAAYDAVAQIPALRRFTMAAIFAVLAAYIMYLLLFKTTAGFRARAVGVNPDAARYMGINVSRTILTTALISGALAGLGGAMEIMGSQHRVIERFLLNAGFDGIPVALIAQLHPLGVLLSALFFGSLRAGANKMQIISGVPVAIVFVIQAFAILFAIAGTTIELKPRAEAGDLKSREVQTSSAPPKEVDYA
jgi:simple sugar transport system permease protein